VATLPLLGLRGLRVGRVRTVGTLKCNAYSRAGRVRTVGKRKCNAHSVATDAHAGWPKATYSRKMTDTTADVGAHTSGRSPSQHVTSTHECQIYIVRQNQMPIHRKTTERPAAVENLNKHRPQTEKPSNPLASAPYAAPATATFFAPSCAAATAPALAVRLPFISPQLTSGAHRVPALRGVCRYVIGRSP
jgi:hypothetical protein